VEIAVTHSNLDFDALASLVAAQKLYPAAKMIITGSPGRNVRQFILLHEDIFDFGEWQDSYFDSVKRLIVVDTRLASRIGEAQRLLKKKSLELVVYDHHPATADDMRADREFVEEVGATTTILIEHLRKKKVAIKPVEASLFALGIHEDTGSLTYPTTTPRDVEALSYLMKLGVNVSVVRYFLNLALSPEQHRLLDESLKAIQRVTLGGREIIITRVKVREFVDGASLVTHKLADLENVDAVFSILETRDRLYIIARSRGEIDVAAVLEKFGGGGHPQAASTVMKKQTVTNLTEELLSEVSRLVSVPLGAQAVMSKPVRWVTPNTSIREVSFLLLKYGHSGFPVMDRGKLVGMISRREVDKAVHHGLSHAPVKGFMSREVVSVPFQTSLSEIQRLMVEKGVGRVPVVDSAGKIVGIVTRSDLLRALHGGSYLESDVHSAEPALSRKKIASLIKKQFPREVFQVIKSLGKLAEKLRVEIYLVGGVVRDLILGVPNLDLDIVVEGDAVRFAQEAAKKLGGRVNAYKKFGTAVLVLKKNFHIDFASSRTEFYRAPAALPEVEKASVREDLGRRDFTFNTMAIALNADRFGELLDYFGGYNDLLNKRLRVLHSLSFVEDPTRIFRAVRFEQKYRLSMDAQTEELAREAIKLKLIKKIGGVRLREEIIPLLSEETSFLALTRLKELGAISFIHPDIKLDCSTEKLFQSAQEAFRYFKGKISLPPLWLLHASILLKDLSTRKVKSWAENLKLRKEFKQALVEAVSSPKLAQKLLRKKILKRSELYKAFHNLKVSTLLFLWCVDKRFKKPIEVFIEELWFVKIELKGKDLLKLGFEPSPLIGRVLEKILCAKLDGKVKRREDEVRLARQFLKEAD
jgi:tRNA nucleotidyltransferase (CCA-adding enzyme)